MKVLDKIYLTLSSQKFERVADKVSYWIVGLSVLYFVVRIMVSVIFDV